MTKLVKFWQFGCWNNLNIDKNGNSVGRMKYVIDYIKETETEAPDFLIISGDNYYPGKTKAKKEEKEKEKKEKDKEKKEKDKEKKEKKDKKDKDKDDTTTKIKTIFKDKLIEGLQYLPENIPIKMLLGNHDLETNNTNNKNNLFIATSASEEVETENGECEIIKLELEALKNKTNVDYFFFKSEQLINNTLLLMIDTSIYEVDAEAIDYLPCYNIFLEAKEKMSSFENIKHLRDYQLEKIIDAIKKDNKSIKHLIIVGHHPIYQLKNKTSGDPPVDNVTDKSDISVDFTPVLKTIFEKLGSTTMYHYLCSDLHLYQKGSITMNFKDTFKDTNPMIINQYIVGSGGTELDPRVPPELVEPDKTYTSKDGSITYIFEDEKREYGFLECIIEKDTAPRFKFMPLETTPTFSELSRQLPQAPSITTPTFSELLTKLPIAPPLSRRSRRARSLSKPRSRSLSRRARSLSRRARSIGGKSKKNYKKTQKKKYNKKYRRIVRK